MRRRKGNVTDRRTSGDLGDPGTSEDPGDNSGTGAEEGAGLRTRRVEESIRGWKTHSLLWWHDYCLVTHGGTLAATNVLLQRGPCKAACQQHLRYLGRGGDSEKPHEAPKVECSCGFYAHKARESVERSRVQVEVDLWGRVIVHETGYRAEWQNVLGLHVSRRCQFCTSDGRFMEIEDAYDQVKQEFRNLLFRCESHLRNHAADVQVPTDQLPELLPFEVQWRS